MEDRYIRISKATGLPVTRATLYKWRHIKKYPRLFVALGRAVCVDMKVLDEIMEQGRSS